MSSNPILSNISSVIQNQNSPFGNSIESYDLSDKTFSNMLDDKMSEGNEDINKVSQKDVISKLGMPAGLQIEGFDYNDMMSQTISSSEKVDAINTDSNINNNTQFKIPSFIKNAIDSFSPVVESTIKNGVSSDTVSEAAAAIKNFWGNQAQNIYQTMNKDTVDNIGELIAKL